MKKKYSEIIMAVILLAVDALYLTQAFRGKKTAFSYTGAYTFPKILGLILAALCVIVILRAFREKGTVKITNLGLTALSVGITAVFVILWQCFGLFYLWASLYVLALLFAFRTNGGRFSKRNVLFNLACTAGVILSCYVIFTRMMEVRL